MELVPQSILAISLVIPFIHSFVILFKYSLVGTYNLTEWPVDCCSGFVFVVLGNLRAEGIIIPWGSLVLVDTGHLLLVRGILLLINVIIVVKELDYRRIN